MPSALPLPPPGFAQLSVSEKVEYIQALWDSLSEAEVTVPESQRDVVRARLEEHQRSPEAGRPWGEEQRDIERAMLHAALEQSVAQAQAGKLIPADEVMRMGPHPGRLGVSSE
jgi:putative addiction module component (TIGR02574 family)